MRSHGQYCTMTLFICRYDAYAQYPAKNNTVYLALCYGVSCLYCGMVQENSESGGVPDGFRSQWGFFFTG